MKGSTNSIRKNSAGYEKLLVRLNTNQSTNTDITGVTVTVTYDGSETDKVWNGTELSFDIPQNKQYTISFSEVEGYGTPSSVTRTAVHDNTYSVTATYQTEKVEVTVSADNGESMDGQIITINGSDYTVSSGKVTAKIPMGASYTISADSRFAFATPASQSFTASAATRQVEMMYLVNQLKVYISSNQGSDSVIDAVKAVVSYDGSSVEVGNGETIKIPSATNVTITYPEVSGYSQPASETVNAVSGLTTKSVTYSTEVVTVTVTADAGGSVSGQTVTINGVTTTLTSTGTVTQKVAYGTSYTVYLNSKTNYNQTSTQTFTASQTSRSVTMAYTIKKETLTVTVSGLSSGFTITVKSGSTTIGTQTSTSKSYTINYGTSYTVSASTVDGYDVSPATFTRTAASSTYSRTITYTPQGIANGIYVVTSDGTCYSSSSSVSGAVGVAVVTYDCCFIMGLSYTGGIPWAAESLSNYNSDISAVPTSTSSSTIATYYDGVSYTDSILSFFSGETPSTCAASNARSQSITFKNSTLSGYLGSAGEWQAVIDNYSTVQTALTNAGGFTIDLGNDTRYWASCEQGFSNAWSAFFDSNNQYLDYFGKFFSYSYFCVVPFYKVNRSDLIAA